MAAVTASVATGVYRPPQATGSFTASPTTSTGVNYGTSTSQPGNTDVFLYYFTVPYLDAHVLSVPSWRYAYILWILIAFVTVVWSLGHQLKRSAGSNWVSASIRKLAVRRVAFGESATKPVPRGTNKATWFTLTYGQLAALMVLVGITLAATFAGPDYLSPTTCTWGGTCAVQVFDQGPPKSTYTRRALDPAVNLGKRSPSFLGLPGVDDGPAPAPAPATLPIAGRVQFQRRPKQRRAQLEPRASALGLNPGGWAPFNDPLLAAPNYTIYRSMWTTSSRIGLIAYALLPLAVCLSLKMWPFALFATPWLTGYGFDKTAVIHRWLGRLIWLLSTAHTVTFAIQLSWDYDPYHRRIILVVWEYYRFNWGVVAYIALTAMVALSFNPLRKRYYELFYYSHCVLVAVFLVGCIVHYEPLWGWATLAIALWASERAARFLVWLWINGLFSSRPGPLRFWSEKADKAVRRGPVPPAEAGGPYSNYPPQPVDLQPYGFAQQSPSGAPYDARQSAYKGAQQLSPSRAPPLDVPSGFALVQLLPGHAIRLTVRTPRRVRWSAGQNVLLNIPSVSWWQSHPFSIANCDPGELPDGKGGSLLVFLVRARRGFTRKLWDRAARESAAAEDDVGRGRGPGGVDGVVLRAMISAPMGSAARNRWGWYQTVVIVCGGSGVTFGLAVLEELTHRMAGTAQRGAKARGRTTRVRFVWILRHHEHLVWVASALRRCMELVGSPELTVELYVSDTADSRLLRFAKAEGYEKHGWAPEPLTPPVPRDRGSYARAEPDFNSSTADIIDGYVPYDRDAGFDAEREDPFASARGLDHRAAGQHHHLPPGARAPYTPPMASPDLSEPAFGHHHGRFASGPVSFQDSVPTLAPPYTYSPMNSEADLLKSSRRTLHSRQTSDDHRPSAAGQDDVDALAPLVRSGKPRLGDIISEESSRSLGETMIACSGPPTLNTLVRKLVSERIHVRGSGLDVYTEDFGY